MQMNGEEFDKTRPGGEELKQKLLFFFFRQITQ